VQHHGGFEPSLVELEAISNAEYWGTTEALRALATGRAQRVARFDVRSASVSCR